jgi:anti-anti-sigma factor
MNQKSASIAVAVAERAVCVRIIGRANFANSVDFRSLVKEVRLRGHLKILLDLTDCMLMDSTFLGVLACLGRTGGEAPGERPNIELLNPNERVLELLDNLGATTLFRIIHCADRPAGKYDAIMPGEVSKLESARACFEAHSTLMTLSQANVAKFKDVTEFLARDLQKLEAQAVESKT